MTEGDDHLWSREPQTRRGRGHGMATNKPSWGQKLRAAVFAGIGMWFALTFAYVAATDDDTSQYSWWAVAISYGIVGLALLGAGVMATIAVRTLLQREPWIELTGDEVRIMRAGEVQQRITLDEAERIALLEGKFSTMQGSRGDLDTSVRGSNARRVTEILIVPASGEKPISIPQGLPPSRRQLKRVAGGLWIEGIPLLQHWVDARPELAQDEDTRDFFGLTNEQEPAQE